MNISRLLFCVSLILLLAQSAIGVQTVRVDATSGAPRLLVDGQPVRARMFWGGPGSRPIPATTAGQELRFEFQPTSDEPSHGTMHFRFGSAAGDIYLDDIRVVDLDAQREVLPRCDFEHGAASFQREWMVWPPKGPQNTVGTVSVEKGVGRDGSAGLHIRLRNPPNGDWPDFHIHHQANLALTKGHRHQVSFWIRAEPARRVTVAFYRPGNPYVCLGGPGDCFASQIRLAGAAGAPFVSFPIGMPWAAPGKEVNWEPVDTACRQVLAANPQALLLPRIGMNAPAWWLAAHPDEAMTWEDGSHGHGMAVPGDVYCQDACRHLADLVRHLEATFGDRIAGYHPSGQNTGEWFYEDTWRSLLNGYAPADARYWRLWLKRRYADDAALGRAWGDNGARLDTAAVPTAKARHAAPAGIFRDPQAERAIVDFSEFQQELMADCVCRQARAVRAASQGRKLVVFFYGYVFEFAPVRNGPATAGHYALRRVLDCPDIDVLCSPISYFDRGLGGSAPAMTAAESVALAGKMWLYEDDTRTYLGTGSAPGWKDGAGNLDDTNRMLTRNVAEAALRNFATWWMDLGATGWFDDPRMWEQMRRLRALDQPLLEHPRPFLPQVAAVIDEPSMIRVAAGGAAVTSMAVAQARRPLGRMGAPYGQYLLDDVTAGRVRAKMYVFLTAWRLSPRQRRELLAATRGSLRIWCYAPGYFDNDHVSPQAMRELTGFELKEIASVPAWAEPTEAGKRAGVGPAFGLHHGVRPLLAAADATAAETLATYRDGSAAVALRQTADGPSLFVGPAGLTAELLRFAADRCGVHLFTRVDCNVYANGPYLAIHAAEDGPIELDTGVPGPVRDLLSGQAVGDGPRLTLPVRSGDTRILVTHPH
jgi:hypothetical protein